MSQFRVPLSQEETALYQSKFNELDVEGLSIVTGESVRPLFAKTGLPNDLLADIWGLGDYENNGFLNFHQFCICARLIGYCQSLNGNTSGVVLSPANYEVFTKFPQFGNTGAVPSTPTPVQPPALQRNSTNNSFTNNNFNSNNSTASQGIPIPSAMDVSKYSQLYDRSSNGQPIINGDTARDIFMKAKLPNSTLGAIWELCDQNQSGYLTKAQFVLAMYLIQLFMSNSISSLPPTLSPQLWQAVQQPTQNQNQNQNQGQGQGHVQAPPSLHQQPSSPQLRNLSTQSTGASMERKSSMMRGSLNSASADWTLSIDKKRSFDAIFDSLDKSKKGKLGSDVLVPFFLTSKLSQDVLATIWDLADIQNNAEFSNTEFAIAMFLIQKKNAGIPLPDVIPEELLNSPSLGLNQYIQPQTQPERVIPNRDTKPTFEQPPPQVSPVQPNFSGNNSALNDLLGLDNSSFSPAPPAHAPQLSASSTGNSFNGGQSPQLTSSHTGVRKFKPSSNFGQSIIKEEVEEVQPQPVQQIQQTQVPPQPLATSTVASVPTASKSTYQSSLPNVPNFAAFAIPSVSSSGTTERTMSPILDNSDASFKMSQATTDLANLSNQVRSISTQSALLHDRKSKHEQELQRINATKTTIESKLATLRASYQQETQQTEKVEAMLAQSRQEVEELTEQLNVAQANYHAVELKLNEVQQQLVEVENSNSQIKEKIGGFNSMSQSLQAELTSKQAELAQKHSMLGISEKQLEVSDMTASNLKNEIEELEASFLVFVNKKKELDDYSSNIEKQHTLLGSRHQEFIDRSKALDDQHAELDQREEDIKQRTLQIQEQETIYHDQIEKLKQMFDHLNSEKEKLTAANEDLENQHYEYVSRVQDLADKQMRLAMGEVPSAEELEELKHSIKAKEIVAEPNAEAETNAFVAPSVTEKSETVFDNAKSNTADTSINEDDTTRFVLPDDSNMEDIPKYSSATSSTFNNPPQSETFDHDNLNDEIPGSFGGINSEEKFKGQVEDDEIIADENASFNAPEEHTEAEKEEPIAVSADSPEAVDKEFAHSENLESTVPSADSPVVWKDAVDTQPEEPAEEINNKSSNINEEFPPIQELHVDESDSSSEDEEQEDKFTDFDEVKPAAKAEKNVTDEFEDFDDLQQAQVDDFDDEDDENEVPTASVDDSFEHVSIPVSAPTSTSKGKNEEWDQLFSGFDKPIAHPVAQSPAGKEAVPNPIKIATTPKSLAIEELSSMGFSQDEAKRALEQNNWDLDSATNFLLDA